MTLDYTFTIQAEDNGKDIVAKVITREVRPDAKAIAEDYLSSTVFLGQGSHFIASRGISAAHVAGLASGQCFDDGGDVTVGAFIEYGKSNYNSRETFASGTVKGKGDTHYQGIGFLGRIDFANGMHVEGSSRAGKVILDYHSNSLGKRAEYDTRNGYVGAHVGIGKTWTLTKRDTFDVYTRGVWMRQDKGAATLSTGEYLEFDKIDSKRLQLGIRYEHTLNGGLQAYTGIGELLLKVSSSYANLGRCPKPRRGE